MGKRKVLVIDDTESIARMVKMHLELTGMYEVKVLTGSQGVMSEIYAFRPEVLLLDLMMPGMGGLEVSEMLNNDPVGSIIPIIVISALDKDADKLKAYKLGITDYLTKPIDTQRLIAAVDKALRSKAS